MRLLNREQLVSFSRSLGVTMTVELINYKVVTV